MPHTTFSILILNPIDKIVFSNKLSELSVEIVLNICNQLFILLFLKFFYQQKHTTGKRGHRSLFQFGFQGLSTMIQAFLC